MSTDDRTREERPAAGGAGPSLPRGIRRPEYAAGPAGESGPRVAVVGVCAAGKSTLVAGLRAQGIHAFAVAQEHSGVPYLWQRQQPDYLVMLDAEWETVRRRRQVSYGPERVAEQRQRLRHARQHADLYLPTDALGIEEVRAAVRRAIADRFGDAARTGA